MTVSTKAAEFSREDLAAAFSRRVSEKYWQVEQREPRHDNNPHAARHRGADGLASLPGHSRGDCRI